MDRTLPVVICVAATNAITLVSLGCSKLKSTAADGGASAAAPAADSLPLMDGFEGEIDVSAASDKPGSAPVALAVMVKSGKVRVDLPEQLAKGGVGPLGANMKGYGLLDSAAKKIYVVLDNSKQVIVIDLNKSGEELKGVGAPGARPEHNGAPAQPATKVTKTGQYDTVAGYKCENWEVATDHREGVVCVAQEGFSWFHIPMTGIPTEHLWMAELLDGKHFPLRFIGYGSDGVKESGRVEVSKIDKKTLAPSEFEYPPNYAQVDLAQMFRGFAAMSGGVPGGMPIPPHPHK
jgi:uncharacterized protein DUF4412